MSPLGLHWHFVSKRQPGLRKAMYLEERIKIARMRPYIGYYCYFHPTHLVGSEQPSNAQLFRP